MSTTDRRTLLEQLDFDLDGQLGPAEGSVLAAAIASDPELAAERRGLVALHGALATARIPVREGFAAGVMASLPRAAWERRGLPAWALPLAATLALALAAVFFLAGGQESPLVGTGFAVLGFLEATALAGAGLVDASWRGLGLGLEELVADSTLSLVAMAFFVVFLDLFFLSLLRRRDPLDVQPILERSQEAGGDAADR